MRDPTKLRLIYAELRKAAGLDASAGDLLRLAHYILRTYTSEVEGLDDFGRPTDQRAFFALPVDEAMQDGGWRILNFESRRGFVIDEIDPQEMANLKIHIGKVLGSQWRQQIRED